MAISCERDVVKPEEEFGPDFPDEVMHGLAISQIILRFAAGYGLDTAQCLRDTGIAESSLCDSESLISVAQELRLLRNVRDGLAEVPALPVELGQQFGLSAFGVWGFLLSTSRNYREAAERAIRYLPLSTAYCSTRAVVQEDEFMAVFDPAGIPEDMREFMLWRDMSTACRLITELGYRQVPIVRIEVTMPTPPDHLHVARHLDLTPVYGSDRNAVVVALNDADRALPTFDARLLRLLEDQCDALLQSLQVAGVSGQVRRELTRPDGLASRLEDVAAALKLTPRTLRRRLDEEGSSFRAEQDACRQKLAAQLLTTSNMKLDELALYLGYSETPSFTRAFRRWYQMSPGMYRVKSRAASDDKTA